MTQEPKLVGCNIIHHNGNLVPIDIRDYKTGKVRSLTRSSTVAELVTLPVYLTLEAIRFGWSIKDRWVIRPSSYSHLPWPDIESLHKTPLNINPGTSIPIEVRDNKLGIIRTFTSMSHAGSRLGIPCATIAGWIRRGDTTVKKKRYQFKVKSDDTPWEDISSERCLRSESKVRKKVAVIVTYPNGRSCQYPTKFDAITIEKLSTVSLNKAIKSGEPDSKGRLWTLA